MIDRQQHVMQRAMDAWDSTTHQKNSDGRLWQCMEELRAESHNAGDNRKPVRDFRLIEKLEVLRSTGKMGQKWE